MDRPNYKIPFGDYCYEMDSFDIKTGQIRKTLCPYWSKDLNKPNQENGYCAYLGYGDWEIDGLSLLWDQCKECGINEEF